MRNIEYNLPLLATMRLYINSIYEDKSGEDLIAYRIYNTKFSHMETIQIIASQQIIKIKSKIKL